MALFLKMNGRVGEQERGSTLWVIAKREINSRELRGHRVGSCAPTARSLVEGAPFHVYNKDIRPSSFKTGVYRGLRHPCNPTS
jgi:hypothetical protein